MFGAPSHLYSSLFPATYSLMAEPKTPTWRGCASHRLKTTSKSRRSDKNPYHQGFSTVICLQICIVLELLVHLCFSSFFWVDWIVSRVLLFACGHERRSIKGKRNSPNRGLINMTNLVQTCLKGFFSPSENEFIIASYTNYLLQFMRWKFCSSSQSRRQLLHSLHLWIITWCLATLEAPG